MARNKATQKNIDKSDLSNYPDARIRNNTGSNDGTPISESVYGDIHETFAKFMRDAGLKYNNLPDNVSNGYQLYDAILRNANKNNFVASAAKRGTDAIFFEAPLNIFKTGESMIFVVNFDSTDQLNKAICTDPNYSKPLKIEGGFKNGQKIRLINDRSRILVSGIYETSDVPNLLNRLTSLENVIGTMNKIIAPIVNGGTPLLWMRPANEIPEGYEEVTDFRGMSLFGYDPNDADFNVVMEQIGSKTFNIAKTNLPSEGVGYQDSYYIENSTQGGSGVDGKITLGGRYFGPNARPDFDNNTLYYRNATTSNLGDGTAIKKLDPSRIVMFIRFKG